MNVAEGEKALTAGWTIRKSCVKVAFSAGSCTAFKKLTHEFEKNVIDAATIGDPGLIPILLEQYNEDVRALDLTPRG